MRAPKLISRHLSARHRELFVDDPYVPLIDGRLFLEGTHIRVRQGGFEAAVFRLVRAAGWCRRSGTASTSFT